MKYVRSWLKAILIILFTTLVLWLFLSNVHHLFSKKISIHQPIENITQIEFGYSPRNENRIIYTLEKEEFAEFLNCLMDLKCFKRTSPSGHHGSLFVQITYLDGSAEILGSSSLRYISSFSQEHDGWYYLMEDDLYELFSSYVDLSGYPHWE